MSHPTPEELSRLAWVVRGAIAFAPPEHRDDLERASDLLGAYPVSGEPVAWRASYQRSGVTFWTVIADRGRAERWLEDPRPTGFVPRDGVIQPLCLVEPEVESAR